MIKTNKKKICIVYGALPPYPDGGADFCYELGKSISNLRDFEVSFLVDKNYKISKNIERSLKVFNIVKRWDINSLQDGVVKNFFKRENFFQTIVVFPCASVNGNKNFLLPALIPFIKGTGIFTVLWFTPIAPRPNFLEFLTAVIIFFKAKKIVAMDLNTSRYFSYFKKIKWSPFGPTLDILNKKKSFHINKKLKVKSNNEIALAYFGYWSHSKGTDLLPTLIQRLKQEYSEKNKRITLYMVGGRSKDRYRSYDKKIYDLFIKANLFNNVIFTGPISSEDVVSIITKCDIFLMPYRKFFTTRSTLSNAIHMESVILMSSNTQTNAHLKHKENVFIIRPNSIESLFEGVCEIINDVILAEKIKTNVKKLKVVYSWKNLANNIVFRERPL